jgi:S1-C subfamily serine protease
LKDSIIGLAAKATFIFALTTIAVFLIHIFGSAPEIPPSQSIPHEVFSKLEPSVLKITDFDERSGGTGFLVKNENGHTFLVTNAHVCKEPGMQMRISRDGDKISYVSKALEIDRLHDLCIMEAVPGEDLEIAEEEAGQYTTAYTLGHPLLFPNTPTQGLVLTEEDMEIAGHPNSRGDCAEDERKVEDLFAVYCLRVMHLRRTTIPTYPGSSGSPVVNSSGKLIGVINSGGPMNHGNYIPLRFLATFLIGK